MAMNSKICAFILFVFIVATFSTGRPITLSDPSSEKVSLALYHETLCPASSSFILNYLNQLFEDNELMEIVDLRLIPYGNAVISNGTIECQHGPWECLFNTMDACVIDAAPSVREHFPFIHCLEKIIEEDFVEQEEYFKLGECFDTIPGVDPFAVVECTNGVRGLELELKYADETDSLRPPHEYVPWVTVNGEPIYEDLENIIARVCEAYKGPNVPKTCTNVSTKSTESNGKIEIKSCEKKELPKRAKSDIKPVIPWWNKT